VGCTLRDRVARWFFQTQNPPKLGKFCRVLDWKMFIYFMAILNILWSFGIFYDHSVRFSGFGIMYQEKSGNPSHGSSLQNSISAKVLFGNSLNLITDKTFIQKLDVNIY
jgi:hypothetical protein